MKNLLSSIIAVASITLSSCTDQITKMTSAGTESGDPTWEEVFAFHNDYRPAPIPVESGVAVIAPENSKVEFTGTDTQEIHFGRFEQFSGEVHIDSDRSTVKSLTVEIQTDSIQTDNDRFTTHLKSPDFLNVRQYPTATFQSTSVIQDDPDQDEYQVTGNITLLGVTKELSFPATINTSNQTFRLESDFLIDRSQFGMNYRSDLIANSVSMSVAVGVRPRSTGGRGRGRGRFDPQQLIANNDADNDGKLTGDEIPERMRERLEQFDTDGDGAISLKELQERRQRFLGGGGQDGRDGRGDDGSDDRDGRPTRPRRPPME